MFRAPVADLLDPERRRSVRLEVPDGIRTSPAFLVDDHLVWGFTAYILDRLLRQPRLDGAVGRLADGPRPAPPRRVPPLSGGSTR